MKLSLICAMSDNGVIGRKNQLPWHLPEDLRYFKRTTMGHAIIMGRKTWESIGRPLPGRTNIVISGQSDYNAAGARVAGSLSEALSIAEAQSLLDGSEEAFVIGGSEIYTQALPRADRIHLTRVHATVEGDAYLTGLDEADWQEVSRWDFHNDDRNEFDYSICILERISRE